MSFCGGSPARRVWVPALVVVVLAVAGVAAWWAIPSKSHNSSNGPAIVGETVKQVLLDGAELTTMLNQPFTTTAGPPIYGGLDAMDNSAPPGDCVGVVDVAPRTTYQSADVQSYARETWVHAESEHTDFKPLSTRVMFVKEAVIALPSAAAAQAFFAKFAEQWQRCDGHPVNQQPDTADTSSKPHLSGTEMHITDVRVADDVLAASIVLDKVPKAPDTRAVGVQGNCLIGVLIAFTGVENATGSADPQTSSINAVRAMMNKVAQLS